MFRTLSHRRGETRTWTVILLTAVVCFALALPLSMFVLLGSGFFGVHNHLAIAEEARVAEMMARQAAEQEMVARVRAEESLQQVEQIRQKSAELILRVENQLYFSRIALAQSEWQGKQPERARAVLEECPAHFRGWEWNLISRLTRSEPMVIKWPHGSITCLAFRGGSSYLAAGGADKHVRIYDLDDGTEFNSFEADPDSVNALAFSPDLKILAVAGSENVVTLRDPETGKIKFTLKGHENWIPSVAFSPDNKNRMATGSSDGTVRIWSWATGEEIYVLKGHQGHVSCVTYSPDGRRLASASFDKTVKIWDPATGKDLMTLTGHTNNVRTVAFSPDGKRLASGGNDNVIRLWDAEAGGKEIAQLKGHINEITGLAYHPSGQRLASSSIDGTVRLWDMATGLEALMLRGHALRADALAFSGDAVGRALATAGRDTPEKPGLIMIWDSFTEKR